MKIIISPAKKMNVDTDSLAVETMPVMLQKTEELKQWIQTLSWEQTKKLWKCRLVEIQKVGSTTPFTTKSKNPCVKIGSGSNV